MDPGSLFDLDGTVAVVTGASGRLGPSIVGALAGAGATVVAVARDRARLDTALAGVSDGGRVLPTACDITSSAWPALLHGVVEEHGRLDVLVNNAHVARSGSLRLATDADWTEAFDLAVRATATALNAARDALVESARSGGPASVVNVASMYGVRSPDPGMYDDEEGRNPPYYGAAKAALIQLTRYAAAELGPDGVRVNALVPGPFPGEATPDTADLLDRIAARTMLGRVGSPDEIAGAVLYLASRAASFTTGSTLVVDGGWTAR